MGLFPLIFIQSMGRLLVENLPKLLILFIPSISALTKEFFFNLMKKFNENPHYMRITLHIESHFLLLGDLNLFTVISEFIFCLIP